MNLIEKALGIALQAHSGQKDKAGKAYILHPLRLMAKMETEEEMAIALLHDVIEDSDCTAATLLREGIPANIVNTVQALTKEKGEGYEAFIDRIAGNTLAVKIKLADIEHNINLLRLHVVNDEDLQRVARYHRAWRKLHQLTNSVC